MVFEHRGLIALAAAVFTRRRHSVHEPELGVDDPGAIAGRAGALGVGAEERRLDAVRLGECVADRVEQAGVSRRVAPTRTADGGLVDRHNAVAVTDGSVNEGALSRAGNTSDDYEQAQGDVDVNILEVVRVRTA